MNEELRSGFEEVNRRMDRRFEDVDHRFEEVDRRFEEVHRELTQLRQGQDDLRRKVRKNGVMIEKLDGDIRLVAEGVVTNRQVFEAFIEETRRERKEDRRIWRSALGAHGRRLENVEGRVDGLEVRVSVLESGDG